MESNRRSRSWTIARLLLAMVSTPAPRPGSDSKHPVPPFREASIWRAAVRRVWGHPLIWGETSCLNRPRELCCTSQMLPSPPPFRCPERSTATAAGVDRGLAGLVMLWAWSGAGGPSCSEAGRDPERNGTPRCPRTGTPKCARFPPSLESRIHDLPWVWRWQASHVGSLVATHINVQTPPVRAAAGGLVPEFATT